MPFFKLSFELNSFRGGWTESIFWEAADITTVYNQATPLINARMLCSPTSVALFGIRIASYPNGPAPTPTLRQTQLIPTNLTGQMPGTSEAPDLLQNKAMIQLNTTVFRSRKFWIGGMADPQTVFSDPDGNSIPGPLLTVGMAQLMDNLRQLPVRVRSILTPVAPYNYFAVVSFLANGIASPSATFNTAVAHGLNPADYVNFGRVNFKIFPQLKGYWEVLTVPSTTSFTIGYYNNWPNTATIAPNGFRVRKVGIQYSPVAQVLFDRFQAHKVGKSIGESRGRARGVSFRR